MKKHNVVLLIGAIFFIILLATAIVKEIKTDLNYLCSQKLDEYQKQECRLYKERNCFEDWETWRCKMTEYNIRNTFKF